MLKNLALALGLGVFLIAGSAAAGTDPAAKCKDSKLKNTGKKAAGILKALGKNISKSPDTKLSANISKAESKFTKAFTKAESGGACPTVGDAAAIENKVNLFAADVIGELTPSPSGAFIDVANGALD